MPIETANYGFIKDDEDEFYNVLRVNANLDKIDTEMKRIENKTNITVPVTKVNGKTGDVILSAGDIKTSENKTIEETLQSHTTSLGEMATLTTTAKTVTGAINELNANKAKDTDDTRTTIAKTVTGAINELNAGKVNNTDLDPKTTGGTSTAYTLTVSNVNLNQWTVVFHLDCGANATLKINGGTATSLKKTSDGTNVSAGDIKANIPYQIVRVGSNFFIRSNSNDSAFKGLSMMPVLVDGKQDNSNATLVACNEKYMVVQYYSGAFSVIERSTNKIIKSTFPNKNTGYNGGLVGNCGVLVNNYLYCGFKNAANTIYDLWKWDFINDIHTLLNQTRRWINEVYYGEKYIWALDTSNFYLRRISKITGEITLEVDGRALSKSFQKIIGEVNGVLYLGQQSSSIIFKCDCETGIITTATPVNMAYGLSSTAESRIYNNHMYLIDTQNNLYIYENCDLTKQTSKIAGIYSVMLCDETGVFVNWGNSNIGQNTVKITNGIFNSDSYSYLVKTNGAISYFENKTHAVVSEVLCYNGTNLRQMIIIKN